MRLWLPDQKDYFNVINQSFLVYHVEEGLGDPWEEGKAIPRPKKLAKHSTFRTKTCDGGFGNIRKKTRQTVSTFWSSGRSTTFDSLQSSKQCKYSSVPIHEKCGLEFLRKPNLIFFGQMVSHQTDIVDLNRISKDCLSRLFRSQVSVTGRLGCHNLTIALIEKLAGTDLITIIIKIN